jgi:hypothetical protein
VPSVLLLLRTDEQQITALDDYATTWHPQPLCLRTIHLQTNNC